MVQVTEELDDEEMVKRAIAMSLEEAKEREGVKEKFSSIKNEKEARQNSATNISFQLFR